MDRLSPGAQRRLKDGLAPEIALWGWGRADQVGLVGHPHMECLSIGFAIHGNRADPKGPAGADDSNSDLAAVCDKNFCEHALIVAQKSCEWAGLPGPLAASI